MLGPEVWRLEFSPLNWLNCVTSGKLPTLSEFQFPPLETGGKKTNPGLRITAAL